jgi:hypothetical protein
MLLKINILPFSFHYPKTTELSSVVLHICSVPLIESITVNVCANPRYRLISAGLWFVVFISQKKDSRRDTKILQGIWVPDCRQPSDSSANEF